MWASHVQCALECFPLGSWRCTQHSSHQTSGVGGFGGRLEAVGVPQNTLGRIVVADVNAPIDIGGSAVAGGARPILVR